MSFADVWDRMFWSVMVVIFVGLVWIKFVEPLGLACFGPGLIVALLAGGIFFYLGVRGKLGKSTSAQEEATEE